ncbi:hypothetical protein [Agrobacterium sp. ST15.13.015]|uniref:hypothetical protein n=1 Tax=Agrobacterium sp. ST15.13.015 TaxID=3017319 RepID=UPI0022C8BF0B|nr:hypothetical protein [Agrobacterium sp. ST15.13.015]MCZ7500643.1 hypothetical protein [Rhizobium rhizogenes]
MSAAEHVAPLASSSTARKPLRKTFFQKKCSFFEVFFVAFSGLYQPETAIPKREIQLFATRRKPAAHDHGNRSTRKMAVNTAV